MSTQPTQIVESAIDCDLMDVKNIGKLIEEFAQKTPLQEAWNVFCIEKSLPNIDNLNDYSIIKSFYDFEFQENVFQNSRKPIIFIEFLGKKLTNTKDAKYKNILNYIASELVKVVDFKFFNASLIYSLDYENYMEIDMKFIQAENSFDNFDPDESEEDFLFAMNNASILALIRACFQNCQPKKNPSKIFKDLKKCVDKIYVDQIPKEIYDRIWERATEIDDDYNTFW